MVMQPLRTAPVDKEGGGVYIPLSMLSLVLREPSLCERRRYPQEERGGATSAPLDSVSHIMFRQRISRVPHEIGQFPFLDNRQLICEQPG